MVSLVCKKVVIQFSSGDVRTIVPEEVPGAEALTIIATEKLLTVYYVGPATETPDGKFSRNAVRAVTYNMEIVDTFDSLEMLLR